MVDDDAQNVLRTKYYVLNTICGADTLSGVETRTIRTGDEAAVTALLVAREAVDGREALSEYKTVRRGDKGSVEVVALAGDGTAAGYGHAAWHPAVDEGVGVWQVEVVPAPGDDEEGTAVALLEGILGLLPGEAMRAVWMWRAPEVAAAERLGLEVVRRLVEMSRPLPAAAPAPVPGVALRTFRPGVDEDAWLEVNNKAFADHSEQGGWDRAEVEVRMEQPWFDPAGLLMAWSTEDGALLGSCWTKVRPGGEIGEIYVVGVVPEAQGRGLGRFLVLSGLAHLAKVRGCHTVNLYTNPADGAIHLYRRLGFEVTFTKSVYR